MIMFRSIYAKIIFFVYLPLIFVLGLSSYLLYSYQRHHLIENIMANTEKINKTIRSSLIHEMIKKDRDDISVVLKNLVENKQVLDAFILNPDGEVSFSAKQEVKARMDRRKDPGCKICHRTGLRPKKKAIIYKMSDGRSIFRTTIPIYNERRCHGKSCHEPSKKINGMLITDFPLTEMEKFLSVNRNIMLISFFVIFIILLGIMRFSLNHTILSPLSLLLKGIKEIGSGNLDFKIQVKSADEIREVADSFNEMALNLKKSRQEIEEWNRTLEQRVEEKTRELKEAHDQLLQAGRMAAIGELAAGVAHELNNPLTGILGYAQYTLEKMQKASDLNHKDVSKFCQYLSYIEKEAQRCKSIVQGLLRFSRAPKVTLEPLDVNFLLEETLILCGHQLEKRGVKVMKEFEPSLPRVMGNANQLQQVFTNIILNAYDAMPKGGSLTITTKIEDRATSRRIRVEFIDTGCGIPSENMRRIFDPFFTTKEVGQGTGLGLAISYGIIKEHHGDITVKSEVGKGSSFTVYLPIFES